jgi:hypothetical protein
MTIHSDPLDLLAVKTVGLPGSIIVHHWLVRPQRRIFRKNSEMFSDFAHLQISGLSCLLTTEALRFNSPEVRNCIEHGITLPRKFPHRFIRPNLREVL